MRTIEKTLKRIVIEITTEEIEKGGFESLWDGIRLIYPTKLYDIFSIKEKIRGMIIEVELRPAMTNLNSLS